MIIAQYEAERKKEREKLMQFVEDAAYSSEDEDNDKSPAGSGSRQPRKKKVCFLSSDRVSDGYWNMMSKQNLRLFISCALHSAVPQPGRLLQRSYIGSIWCTSPGGRGFHMLYHMYPSYGFILYCTILYTSLSILYTSYFNSHLLAGFYRGNHHHIVYL